ncbi:MAG: aspartate aminotransferase family protein [Rhizobiales bacterium]|nr:aspartate aminotransferase family protein [Hyphomicrobiales bacterium]MBO6700499.1 aspartate aminotransferase family protein [Hyphomicrobiales bacterium]MBO6738035.1 aspartate aminotransferase family protein [Hyphomicrobiales bacterium]MBO6913658.1 aspartate aminotransferase family protein [Hyphomicrobiales bacterium]MBO6954445.1 aspartate aminotransferase family protein [Hyphomicrobiales bacterium]
MLDSSDANHPAAGTTPLSVPNDLDAFWMPYTANRAFKTDPRMITGSKDNHYFTPDGRAILDGTAGLWCCNAGHCRAPVVEAIQNQAASLDFAPTFQFGHPIAFEVASRIASEAPDGLDHVFFANSGSEGVDTALKIALAYNKVRGDGGRTRLIGRERGYHGSGFGGISVGGIVNNRKFYGALIAGVDHLPHTYNRAEQAFTKGEPDWGLHLADDLESIVALHGPDTIAAVIVEPMAGSTGVLPPPKGYLKRLREITAKHGILLIFDEVISAFGRLGTAFAAQRYDVTPDMIVFAKGITSGTVPMGGVIASTDIYNGFMESAGEGMIELFHGYTYSGHPLACAAALATLNVYRDEGLYEKAAQLEGLFADAAHSYLADLPIVEDIRTCGIVAGIDITPIEGKPTARAFAAMQDAFHNQDMMIRVTGDTIALSPPLTFSESDIDQMFAGLKRTLQAVS